MRLAATYLALISLMVCFAASAGASPYTVFDIEHPEDCQLHMTDLNSAGLLVGGCVRERAELQDKNRIVAWSPGTGSTVIKNLCERCSTIWGGVHVNDDGDLWALVTEEVDPNTRLARGAFYHDLDSGGDSVYILDDVYPPEGVRVRDPERPLELLTMNREGVVLAEAELRSSRRAFFLIDPLSASATRVRRPRGARNLQRGMQLSGEEVWFTNPGFSPAGSICSPSRCIDVPVQRHLGVIHHFNTKGDLVGTLHRESLSRHSAVVWERKGPRRYNYQYLDLPRPVPVHPYFTGYSVSKGINNNNQIVGFDIIRKRIYRWNRRVRRGVVRWVPRDITRVIVRNSAFRPRRSNVIDLRVNDCGDIFLQYSLRRSTERNDFRQVFLYNNRSVCERPPLPEAL